MKKKLVQLTLLLVSICLTGPLFSQEANLSKYNFPVGKRFIQTTQINTDIMQSMMGREMKTKSDVSTTTEMSIEGIDKDGNTTMLVSLLAAKVHTAAPGIMDTSIMMNDLKDIRRIVFSSTGKKTTETKLDTSKTMNTMGSMNQYSKFPELPGKVVKIGEKWTERVVDSTKATPRNPFGTNVTNEIEYSYAGLVTMEAKEYIKITYAGTQNITGKGMQMGMEMFIEGTGKSEGYYLLDKKSNMVFFSDGNTELDMSIAVTGQQNMTIPMTQSIKTTIKVEEKK